MAFGYLYNYLPLWLFLAIWTLVFVLLLTAAYPFHYVHSATVGMLIVSIATVVLGYFFYRWFFLPDSLLLPPDSNKQSILSINYQQLSLAVILLAIFVGACQYYNLTLLADQRGGIEQYFANPIMSRNLITATRDAVTTDWNPLLSLSGYGVTLIYLLCLLGGLLFTSPSLLHRVIAFVPLIITLGISLIRFSRYHFVATTFLWLLSCFYASYYLPKIRQQKNLRSLVFLIIGAGLLFTGMSYLVVSLRFFNNANIDDVFLYQFYAYIAGNVISLDKFLMSDPDLLWGQGLFRTLFRWLARFGLWTESDVLPIHYTFVSIGPGHSNTYTYVKELFEDFGLVGLVFLSFLWGFIAASITAGYLRGFSLVRLHLVGLIAFSLFMSFYAFYLINVSSIAFVVVSVKLFDLTIGRSIFSFRSS